MQIIPGIRHLDAPFPSSVVTVGNFDGVHLGHRALVSRVVEEARANGVPAIVVTFEPHPIKVLYPDRDLHRVFDLEDLKVQLALLGIDGLVIEPFSREFSQLPPERFVLDWIFKPFNPRLVVVGYDFSFGANRQGSIDFLKSRAVSFGFQVEVVSPVKVGEVLVSSTRIRQAIEVGDVELAARLLGRRFYLNGLVEKGAGRGRTIGVPTANLRTSAELIPARGVYAATAKVRGKAWPAAVNVGLNPTFTKSGEKGALSVEAHLIGFPGSGGLSDIYGESVCIEFTARLREEKKFSSIDELVTQIKADIVAAEKFYTPDPGTLKGGA